MRIASGVIYTCSDCGTEKPEEDFGLDRNQARGRKYACKECTNAKRRGRYQKENRRYHLKRAYGITPKQYENMSQEQMGICAICLEPTKLYIDHDHVTGEVRGLLCQKCNSAIGLLYDNPARIDRAAKYVRGLNILCV